MRVLIKGMEMPQSCYFCPLTNDGFYLCKANNPYKYLEDDCEERRPDWCPLVPVPPHGRLIDADALIHEIEKWDGVVTGYIKQRNGDMVIILKDQETIIPEEEGET